MKREPTEPHSFIKPTGVGIPRFQAGEEVKSQILKQHGMDVKAQDSLGNGAREAAKLRMQELIAHMSDGFMDSKKDETDLDRHMEQGKG